LFIAFLNCSQSIEGRRERELDDRSFVDEVRVFLFEHHILPWA